MTTTFLWNLATGLFREKPALTGISGSVNFSSKIDTANLKDRSVLITGAAGGLGAALATALAEKG